MGITGIIAFLSLIMYIVIFGVGIYIAVLVIKALKVYIKKNS